MPRSTLTDSANFSDGSPRRPKTYRTYHKIGPASSVDESLFGFSTTRDDFEEEKPRGLANKGSLSERIEGYREPNIRKSFGEITNRTPRKTVPVVTKDLIRNLIIPEEDPSGRTLVLHSRDLERMINKAAMMSEEEHKEALQREAELRDQEMNDIEERKSFMKLFDMRRKKNDRLQELEEEIRGKNTHESKNKIFQQMLEQEDEIKQLNEMINAAKVHVILDAQLQEKEIVQREIEEENQRLDRMMEVDRQNAIRVEEEILQKRREERLLGARKIMEQIEENEEEHLIELEMKDQEQRAMRKYQERLNEMEAESIRKHREELKTHREELIRQNKSLAHRKELEKVQEKLAEERVVQFQKEQAERDAAAEEAKQQLKIKKDRDFARMQALQKRAMDEQAERDAVKAKRAELQWEKEYRKKVAFEEKQRADMEATLKKEREQQLKQKEHLAAVMAQRDRADVERVVRFQQDEIERQKRLELEAKQRLKENLHDVRMQISERQQMKIADRKRFFEEGAKYGEEAKRRQQLLEEYKQMKLNELRESGISEKYLTQIERKINHQHQLHPPPKQQIKAL